MKEAPIPSVPSVQVATARPMSSNPVLQVYVAVSPTELPVKVTCPLLGSLGIEHIVLPTTKYVSLVALALQKKNLQRRHIGGSAGFSIAKVPIIWQVAVL